MLVSLDILELDFKQCYHATTSNRCHIKVLIMNFFQPLRSTAESYQIMWLQILSNDSAMSQYYGGWTVMYEKDFKPEVLIKLLSGF